VKESGKQANSNNHTLKEMRHSLELDQYKARPGPSFFPPFSTAAYPSPLHSSLIHPMKTTHTDPLTTRETTFTSPHSIPLLISARFQNAFNHLFYSIPPSASNPLFMCLPKPCPSFPPKNQLHCLFTTTGKIPLWVRIAVMCPEQPECPSHTSLTARPITGLW